jgi:hypothetical protein
MASSNQDLIHDFLRSKGIPKLKPGMKTIETVKSVAEIPWGEGRTIEDVLLTKKVGTCTGKHLVLQACLDVLGVEYRPVVCTFHWGDQQIKYPDGLKAILKGGEWEHGHNFVQIRIDGKFLDVDVTWNSKLKSYGFKTFPTDWDGRQPILGMDYMHQRWDGADIKNMKNELIERLNPETKKRREQFLKGFIKWVDGINSSGFK